METTKCPVCGKPGIPDYHNEDVTCPQCKSDLSIYRVIDKIPEEKTGFNIWKSISAVAILATAVCGFFLFQNINNGKQKDDVEKNDAMIAQLQDSITTLKTDLQELNSTPAPYIYIVRKGDSYWSISKKFYGTGTRYEEIAEKNNRTKKTPLEIGDTIKIYQ